MNMTDWPFGIVEIIWTLGTLVFTIGPFVLILLGVKWLYESKKSLVEISTTLKELKAEVSAGKTSMENDHE